VFNVHNGVFLRWNFLFSALFRQEVEPELFIRILLPAFNLSVNLSEHIPRSFFTFSLNCKIF